MAQTIEIEISNTYRTRTENLTFTMPFGG